MVNYEILLLMRPDLSKEKQDELKDQIVKVLEEEKGSLISYDRWGKYLLSYPIEKCAYGIYSLLRFSIAKEHATPLLEKLKALCAVRLGAFIMRFTIIKLIGKVSADYRRPDSLEDAPRRDKSYDMEGAWAAPKYEGAATGESEFEEVSTLEA